MSSSPANAISAAPQKHQCRLRLVSHRQKATRTKVDGFVEVHPKGLRWIDHERVSDLLKNHGRALAAWTHVERVSVEAADASFLKASKYKLVVSVAIPSSRGLGGARESRTSDAGARPRGAGGPEDQQRESLHHGTSTSSPSTAGSGVRLRTSVSGLSAASAEVRSRAETPPPRRSTRLSTASTAADSCDQQMRPPGEVLPGASVSLFEPLEGEARGTPGFARGEESLARLLSHWIRRAFAFLLAAVIFLFSFRSCCGRRRVGTVLETTPKGEGRTPPASEVVQPLHPDGDLPLRSPITTALQETSSTSSNSQNHVQTQRLKRFSYSFSGFENRRAFVMFLSGLRDAVRSHANEEEQSRILPGLLLPEVRSSVGRASESGGSGDGRLVEGEKATKAEGDPAENLLDADLHDLGGSPLEATETSTHPAEISDQDRSAPMRAEWFALPQPTISGDRAELADGLFHNCSVSDFLNLFILVDCTHPLIKVPSKGGLPHANTVLLGDFFREEGRFGIGTGEGGDGGELLEDERLVGYDPIAELAKRKQEGTTSNSTVLADKTRSWEKVPFWEKVRQQTFEKLEGSFVLDESSSARRKARHSVCEIGRWKMPKRGERSPKYARNVRFDVDSPNPMGPKMTTMSEIVEFFVDEEQALHVTKASSAESVPFQESFRFDLHFLVKPDPRVGKAVLLLRVSVKLWMEHKWFGWCLIAAAVRPNGFHNYDIFTRNWKVIVDEALAQLSSSRESLRRSTDHEEQGQVEEPPSEEQLLLTPEEPVEDRSVSSGCGSTSSAETASTSASPSTSTSPTCISPVATSSCGTTEESLASSSELARELALLKSAFAEQRARTRWWLLCLSVLVLVQGVAFAGLLLMPMGRSDSMPMPVSNAVCAGNRDGGLVAPRVEAADAMTAAVQGSGSRRR